jgi:hypothetical protein
MKNYPVENSYKPINTGVLTSSNIYAKIKLSSSDSEEEQCLPIILANRLKK